MKLKHKQAIDNIETRITNVKGFADQVSGCGQWIDDCFDFMFVPVVRCFTRLV